MPGAFRVRIFHAREKARAYAAREADFGRSLRVSFAKFDPATYSWKIPHFLFQGDWATFSPTWPRYGMMVRGECYPLQPWVADTGVTAFGELSAAGIESAEESAPWPTPTVHDKIRGQVAAHGREKHQGYGTQGNLNDAVVRRAESAPWPTPTAHAAKPVCNEKPRNGLNYAVERGKTKSHLYPTVGTQTMGGCSGSFAKLKELEEIGRLTPEERRAMSSHLTGGKDPDVANCGMLNPDWVEWLMGWPIWWTDVEFFNADGGQCVMPWLDLADDPAEWPTPLMQRITTRKTHRVHRIETLGNGQVPLCAAVAFIYGRAILRVALRLAA